MATQLILRCVIGFLYFLKYEELQFDGPPAEIGIPKKFAEQPEVFCRVPTRH